MPEVVSITHLKVGDKAPSFKAKDQDGNEVASADLKGKKYVIYFYPNDDTETCTKQACNLRDNFTKLKNAGFVIIGVSHAPQESKKKFATKYKLPFQLLADTDKKMVTAYGVYGQKLFMGKIITTIHRITFIVNEKGLIANIIHKVTSGKASEQILQSGI
jgi:thioredoxin-dependent peroxiredoxin